MIRDAFTAQRGERGLTYGEMLVVLAVFSTLALLFVFSSQHAMLKTRLSVVRQEQKTISDALQNYRIYTSTVPSESQSLRALNSPGGLLKRTPADPFSEPGGQGPRIYEYYEGFARETGWLIVSVGPDGDSDVAAQLEEIRKQPAGNVELADDELSTVRPYIKRLTRAEIRELIARSSYDPTNGVISDGDVIFLGD